MPNSKTFVLDYASITINEDGWESVGIEIGNGHGTLIINGYVPNGNGVVYDWTDGGNAPVVMSLTAFVNKYKGE